VVEYLRVFRHVGFFLSAVRDGRIKRDRKRESPSKGIVAVVPERFQADRSESLHLERRNAQGRQSADDRRA
jgi:hypothetical protein